MKRSEHRRERLEESPEGLEEDASDEALEGLEGVHGWSEEELHSLKRKGFWASRTRVILVSLILLVLALLTVFLIMRPKLRRVERAGGVGEIHEVSPAPEEPSATEHPAKSAKEDLQLQEELVITSTLESHEEGGTIEPSSGEPLVLQEKSPLFPRNVEMLERQAGEERKERVVALEAQAGFTLGSPVAGRPYTVNVGSFREKAKADRYVEEQRERV